MNVIQDPPMRPHIAKGIPSVRLNRVQTFIALSNAVNGVRDDHAVLREVLDGLVGLLEARAGLAMISNRFLYTKYRSASEPMLRLEATLRKREENVAGLFADWRRPFPHHAGELLLVPLIWREKSIGALAFDTEKKRLLPSDKASLHILSNQIAGIFGLGMEQTRVPDEREPKRRDLRDAIAVQQSLMPSIPSSPTCGLSIATFTQSAEGIGGDYFDLVLLDESRMGIVIADVEGRGISAALFGNLLRTTTHFLTRETPSAAAVMGKINAILHKEAASARKLFTMFYAVFDRTTRILSYSGSGHICPLVIRHRTGEVIGLRSQGALIGADPGRRFDERSVQLETGDLVVYFTDGVTEFRGNDMQPFGEDRLRRALVQRVHEDAESVLEGIRSSLMQFSSLPPADDLTLVVTKVQ